MVQLPTALPLGHRSLSSIITRCQPLSSHCGCSLPAFECMTHETDEHQRPPRLAAPLAPPQSSLGSLPPRRAPHEPAPGATRTSSSCPPASIAGPQCLFLSHPTLSSQRAEARSTEEAKEAGGQVWR